MTNELAPFTKLVLVVTAVVQFIMALAGFLLPDLTGSLLSPAKNPPVIAIQYVAAFYLAGAVAAVFALRQDNWVAARTYLLNAVIFVALAIVVTLLHLGGGLEVISYAYLALSIIYIPVIVYVWMQESKRHA